jgi:hypothetical protein
MTILTIKIPDGKAPDVSAFVKNVGGEVLSTQKKVKPETETNQDDEVTHESYFGENIRRVIKAFKS